MKIIQSITKAVIMVLISTLFITTQAEVIAGKVVKIVDGDTVYILIEKELKKVRLAFIDSPERGQPFYKKSKEYLSGLVGNREVIVTYSKIDIYGRIIGTIKFAEFDINLAMVRSGLAWHFKAYEKDQTLSEAKAYRGTEKQAKLKQAGLWIDHKPLAPWVFRKNKRDASPAK